MRTAARNDPRRPANENKPPVLRFADWIGRAMLLLTALSFLSLWVAIEAGDERSAWLFLGSAIAASLTMCLVSVLEHRLS